MEPKIYYINGVATSGKDAFLDCIEKFISIDRTSTVDRIKEIAEESFGWDGIKDEKGRKLLASLRYAWGEYNNGPIKNIEEKITNCKNPAIFIMVREFREMMKMKELFGGETVVVTRPGVKVGAVEQEFLNQVPGDYTYDHTILNDKCLEHLSMIAKHFSYNTILEKLT